VRVTYNDIILLALSKAVKYVPIVNSSVIGNEIKIWKNLNIGIAVAVEEDEYLSGLIVPVVKNVEKMNLIEISRTSRDLIERVREGKYALEDVSGGTMTVSNVAGLVKGWSVSTPIINQPQTVILSPGAIHERPVVKDGQMVIRSMMTMSITFDHRIVDGAPIFKFAGKLAEYLENPDYLHL
jgi:pyruvate dehydrogenase E2 component (dihydrolipoamide acetyltransferase)/2-oxoglutarate dehydrogenase E2 component (dihydrolipoamide succinyltransferase)